MKNIRRRLLRINVFAAAFAFVAALPQLAVGAETKVVTPEELWALFPVKAMPLYPYEARRARAPGSGISGCTSNRTAGCVRSV